MYFSESTKWLTEGQPGLLDLQVNIEVGGETDISNGRRGLLIVVVLPVAVPNPYKTNSQMTGWEQ